MARSNKMMDMPTSESETSSVEIRKISNGYICRHSKYDNGKYTSHEVYYDKKPQIATGATSASSGSRKAKSTTSTYRRRKA